MKKAITAFALFALTALAACAADDSYSRDSHHKNWRERAFEPKGGGAHFDGTPSDVMGGGFGG